MIHMVTGALEIDNELELVFKRGADGARSCVPIFGAGLNIQAAAEEGYIHKDDWTELLKKIGLKLSLDEASIHSLPRTHLALWETLLCLMADDMGVFAYKAENQLQKFVSAELRSQESESGKFKLYGQIAKAGFVDIISLNFDRRIAMSTNREKFVVAPRPNPYGAHGESLFRHSLITGVDGRQSRIWYPHGDAKKFSTIKLGVRKYGFYISIFREHLLQLGRSWRKKSYGMANPENSAGEVSIPQAPTWLDFFFERPLVFIGCGLSPNEWPLLWLLRQREHNRQSDVPTYLLTLDRPNIAAQVSHLRLIPSMQIIAYDSPKRLWDDVRRWIADN